MLVVSPEGHLRVGSVRASRHPRFDEFILYTDDGGTLLAVFERRIREAVLAIN